VPHPTAYSAVDALLKLADSAGALIGSVPRAVRHQAKAEVLVVDTR